jgi:uncharacterized radical SAM superfamily Fe-S cluster-containing enzyme
LVEYSYECCSFILKKDEEKSLVEINDFDNFFNAVNFYKSKLNEIKKENEKENFKIWFIYLSKINCKVFIDEDGIENTERRLSQMLYEGNM